MNRRWLTRALIALIVLAVTVPALASAATAAGAVRVPSIDAAAKVYPHLAGGTATESATKVYGPGKKCGTTKVIKGATGRMASYAPDYTSGDPDAFAMTGTRPSVSAQAYRFKNAKAAIAYLHAYDGYAKKCPAGKPGGGAGGGGGTPSCKATTKKITFKLGDERWGYQVKSVCPDQDPIYMNTLFARSGRVIVYTSAMSMDGAPSIPTSVSFTKLALKTAA